MFGTLTAPPVVGRWIRAECRSTRVGPALHCMSTRRKGVPTARTSLGKFGRPERSLGCKAGVGERQERASSGRLLAVPKQPGESSRGIQTSSSMTTACWLTSPELALACRTGLLLRWSSRFRVSPAPPSVTGRRHTSVASELWIQGGCRFAHSGEGAAPTSSRSSRSINRAPKSEGSSPGPIQAHSTVTYPVASVIATRFGSTPVLSWSR